MSNGMMVTSKEALEAVIRSSRRSPVVFTTGYTCRRAFAIHDAPNHFYMLGSMGLACAIGAGLAIANRDVLVVVVDGDGSLLMNPANSLLLAAYDLRNLHHVVLDNGRYASTGNQPTISSSVHFPELAKGLGYRDIHTVANVAALTERLVYVDLGQAPGPAFSYCRVADDGVPPGSRIDTALPTLSQRLGDWLRQHHLARV